MTILGLGNSGLGASLHNALGSAVRLPAAAAPAPYLGGAGDPLQPDFRYLSVPTTAFEDRVVRTTVDDIELRIDVSRVAKQASAAGAPVTGDSATAVVHIRLETTYDPLTGDRTQRQMDSPESSSGAVDPQTLARITSELQDGDGRVQGAVDIRDERTTTETRYATSLQRDDRGQLVERHDIATSASTATFTDRAESAILFDASLPQSATAKGIAAHLLAGYSADASLLAHIPGLHIAAES